VTSRVLHPMFGFILNWIYVIGGGCGMAAGFIFYQGFIPVASTFQLAGKMTNSSGLISASHWFANVTHRLWITLGFMVLVWLLKLQGLDRIKLFMKIVIYTPIVGTVTALILLFAVSGQTSFDKVFGAGKFDGVITAADKVGVKDAMMSPWGALLAVLWAYSALEITSFVGSEVKTPRTSFLRGLLIGALAVGSSTP
jgi:APA family basic amino acid/polyamine antiporter